MRTGCMTTSQYTTARDLGVLAAALRREFPQYASYFSIEGLSNGKQVIPSHNKLLGRFEGADGMKTGYTCPAGLQSRRLGDAQRPHADGGRHRRHVGQVAQRGGGRPAGARLFAADRRRS